MREASLFAYDIRTAFNVQISESEAEKITTAGKLHDFICQQLRSKLPETSNLPCVTSVAFYRLRGEIRETTGLPLRDLTPRSPVEIALPPISASHARRETWARLQSKCGMYEKFLVHSKPVSLILRTLIWSTVILMAECNLIFGFGIAGWSFCFFGWLIALCTITILAQPLAVHMPAGNLTLGDLARRRAEVHYIQIAEARRGWNEKEVWRAIRGLIAIDEPVAPEAIDRDLKLYVDTDED